MLTRSKNPRAITPKAFYGVSSLTADQRKRIEQNRLAAADLRRARGWVRTGGAWRRAMPNSGETHYNDCTYNQVITTGGAFLTLTCVSPTAAAPVNPTAITSLNLISQGTTQHQRIGNKMRIHAIRFRGVITLQPNISFSSGMVRVLLVRDKQSNGTMPAVSDVLEPTAAATTDVYAFADMDNLDRFDIVKDKLFRVGESGYGVVGTSCAIATIPFKMSHKIRNPDYQEIVFSSTTGAQAEVRSNNYFVIVIASNAQTAITGKSRVYYRE